MLKVLFFRYQTESYATTGTPGVCWLRNRNYSLLTKHGNRLRFITDLIPFVLECIIAGFFLCCKHYFWNKTTFSEDMENNWQIIIICHRINPWFTKSSGQQPCDRTCKRKGTSLNRGFLEVFYKLFISIIYICTNPTIIMDYTKYTTFSIDKNNKYVINIC